MADSQNPQTTATAKPTPPLVPVKSLTIVEKLTPPPQDTNLSEPEIKARVLTKEEEAAYAECRTWMGNALRKNGISPNPIETQWLGAELADFVLGKMRGTEKPSVAPTSPEPTPGFKAA